MKKIHSGIYIVLFLIGAFAHSLHAEELQTFCSQTCGLWPKLCAEASVCLKLCKTPHRLMKACRSNKVPVDTAVPDLPYSKEQFCGTLCSHESLRCSVATYCIQACRTPAMIIQNCLSAGNKVDTVRPRIKG